MLGRDFTGDEENFSVADRSKLSFTNGVVYRHKVLRINYTSDSLNPRTHPNIIILSHEDDNTHPYWYAKIIGIFHAVVQHPSKPDPTSMDFLWGMAATFCITPVGNRSIFRALDLWTVTMNFHLVFLDPLHVIRGCHLIPAFHDGRTDDLLPPSIARLETENNEDWLYYYVNMFVI